MTDYESNFRHPFLVSLDNRVRMLRARRGLTCRAAQLQRAHGQIAEMFAENSGEAARIRRIALVGLRGAGKSTRGKLLTKDFGWPFIELSREIEKYAGSNITEIQSLHGANAYRSYETRAI
jgi:XRE family aerobic/anaerobic benzoate catabolism transcriptional regulator